MITQESWGRGGGGRKDEQKEAGFEGAVCPVLPEEGDVRDRATQSSYLG